LNKHLINPSQYKRLFINWSVHEPEYTQQIKKSSFMSLLRQNFVGKKCNASMSNVMAICAKLRNPS
tara:strand:- start:1647 stop:1844 length:198 start_codon:yes stop_codon:yes gene_type:complete